MSLELKKVGDVSVNGIKAILHGGTGTGKTASIRTIPDQDKVLILCSEQGLLTIKEVCKSVAYVDIRSGDDLLNVYENLNKGGEWESLFNTVVFDSLTEIAEIYLSSEMGNVKDGRQAYGNTHNTIIKVVRAFKDLPMNVIFICHQAKLQDDTDKIYLGADFPGKQLTKDLPYQVDAVVSTRVYDNGEGFEYQFVCKTDGFIDAKIRDPHMNINAIEPADWSVIFNKLNGKGKGKQRG